MMRSQDSDNWWAVKLEEGFPGGRSDGSVAFSSNGYAIVLIMGAATAAIPGMALHALTRSAVAGVVSILVLLPMGIVASLNVVGLIEARLHR